MRIAVLSDVHSNLEALTAVFEEIDERGVEAVYCLGDVVGYGADPVACVELIRERCAGVVRGNHDEAVAMDANVRLLPSDGRAAARHNREALPEEHLTWLRTRPLSLTTDGCTFVHATPEEPGRWHRMGAFSTTRRQFDHFDTAVCFLGHTHVPGTASDRIGVTAFRRGRRYLVNPGSVGQPRDGDPRASFAVYDASGFTCEIVRVPYAVETSARKIVEARLPLRLAERLAEGR